jgi:hypothetical protein
VPSGSEFGKGAIIFLINRSYLTAFKVFIYTLRHAISAATEDIVIITDDPIVASDPFVTSIADRVIPIDQGAIDKLKSIDSSIVSGKHKTQEFGAYWYLKFLIYHDFGYDYQIFLDADMICVADDFRFTEIPLQYDFCAARTVGPKALGVEGIKGITSDIRERCLETILSIAVPEKLPNAINSGVVVIGSALMGRGTEVGLIRLSSQQAFRLEQDALWRYIKLRRDLSVGAMPIWLNFPEYCKIVGRGRFTKHLLPKIRILHLNRLPKPWAYEREKATWIHQIWWEAFDEAQGWIIAVETGRANGLRPRPSRSTEIDAMRR